MSSPTAAVLYYGTAVVRAPNRGFRLAIYTRAGRFSEPWNMNARGGRNGTRSVAPVVGAPSPPRAQGKCVHGLGRRSAPVGLRLNLPTSNSRPVVPPNGCCSGPRPRCARAASVCLSVCLPGAQSSLRTSLPCPFGNHAPPCPVLGSAVSVVLPSSFKASCCLASSLLQSSGTG